MGCCHYLQLVYGIFVKNTVILEKYHKEFEKYKQESQYSDYSDSDFLMDFEISYKDVIIKFFETDEHGFGDLVLIGFSIESNDEIEGKTAAEIVTMPLNKTFTMYNDFFAKFEQSDPKIVALMGGCSCCT